MLSSFFALTISFEYFLQASTLELSSASARPSVYVNVNDVNRLPFDISVDTESCGGKKRKELFGGGRDIYGR